MISVAKKVADSDGFPVSVPCWDGIARGVVFWCPNGHVGILSNHAVDGAGVVTPSVVCDRHGCGFHDHVTLLGYTSE